jgi:phosphoglycolate phosphatase
MHMSHTGEMIQAIIFDWDGVLVDSMPSIGLGIQETALSYGVHVTLEEVLDGYFQPREAYYKSLGIDISNIDELNIRHHAAILKHRQPAPLFPEVAAILIELQSQRMTLAIASTAETDYLIKRLKDFQLEDIFPKELILGGEIHKEKKLEQLVQALGAQKEEVIYVGDLPSDIAAAKAVGVISAGIERREAARKRLAALSPDYLFASLTDLQTALM